MILDVILWILDITMLATPQFRIAVIVPANSDKYTMQ